MATPLDHRGKVINPVDARSGIVSGRIMTVLVTSLILAAVAGCLLYLWWQSFAPPLPKQG